MWGTSWSSRLVESTGYGYYPNAKKMWLVVKPQHLELAHQVFADISINITAEGRLYLEL